MALEPERSLAINLAWFYYLARRNDAAIDQARRTIAAAIAAFPASALKRSYWTLVLAALAKGDGRLALAAARDESRAMAHPSPATLADFWVRAERDASRETDPARLGFAIVAAIELGHADRALDLLGRQCRERSGFEIPFLQVNPVYDSLRGRPRFAALLRCAQLVE
jgi:hypothetical protein